jgi:hypothetical protein
MSPKSDRPIVRNASRRPVELHLSSGTVVLLPGETIEAPADDPYCLVLEKRGLLTRHAAPAKPAARGGAAKKTTRRATQKSTYKTTTKKATSEE